MKRHGHELPPRDPVPSPAGRPHRAVRLSAPLLAFALCSCVGQLRHYVDRVQAIQSPAELFAGRVRAPEAGGRAVFVVALAESPRSGRAVAAEAVGRADGAFLLVAPTGTRRLLAFVDEDGDLRWRPSEPAVEFRAAPIDVLGASGDGLVDVTIAASARVNGLERLDVSQFFAGRADRGELSRVGATVSLAASPFAPEAIKVGQWDPETFYAAYGPSLTFLEPYDAQRIPVLFVHGAAAGPRDFEWLIANLDRSRFQTWVFHYGSGSSLRLSAAFLDRALQMVQDRHRPARVFLVAHSMGGIVARQMLLDRQAARRPTGVDRFLTLATPWMGNAAAGMGVRKSPIVADMWRDMDPKGDLVVQLFDRRLRDSLCIGLTFGFAGNNRATADSNDGTVSLESVLRREAQEEARFVRGVNAAHAEILRAPDAARLLDDFLGESSPCRAEAGRSASAP